MSNGTRGKSDRMKHGAYVNIPWGSPLEMSCSKNTSGSWRQMVMTKRKRNYHWTTNLLHRMYHWHKTDTEEVADTKKSYQLLEKAGLKNSTKVQSEPGWLAGIMFRNMCCSYGQVSNSRWEMLPQVVENNGAKKSLSRSAVSTLNSGRGSEPDEHAYHTPRGQRGEFWYDNLSFIIIKQFKYQKTGLCKENLTCNITLELYSALIQKKKL